MSRLAWFLLQDGRSVIASCEAATAEKLRQAIRRGDGRLVFTGEEEVQVLPSSQVRGFTLLDQAPLSVRSADIFSFVAI
jgi:hypothetical protein